MPKVTLSQTYVFAGRHYGPGEVDVADEETARALRDRDAAVQGAPAPQMDEGAVDAEGAVRGPAPVEHPTRKAEGPSVPRRKEG